MWLTTAALAVPAYGPPGSGPGGPQRAVPRRRAVGEPGQQRYRLRTPKVRAASEGASLSDFVAREVIRVARAPTDSWELDAPHPRAGAEGVTTAEVLDTRDAGGRG